MGNRLKFLVLDLNAEGLQLLSRTLARKYPTALIYTASDIDTALEIARRRTLDVIVVHRPIGMSGRDAIRALSEISAGVPIIWVSGSDHSALAAEAGASAFLLYDEWLLLGGVVADALKQSSSPW